MAIRKIELYGSEVLRQKCVPVAAVTPELRELVADMVDTMHHAQGAGIAAPQVGVPIRVLLVDLGARGEREHLACCINPEWVSQEGEMYEEEGCLSIPKIYEKVKRPLKVKIRALDLEWRPFELEGEEFLSKALCHEMDHLNGILFPDHLSVLKRDMVKRKIKKFIRDGEWDDPYPIL
jgi:peptide deformylase